MSFSLNQSRLGMIIPTFVGPTNSLFTTIIQQKQNHPNVPMAVVLDVSQGPGSNAIAQYTELIGRLNNESIITLGYVFTDFGAIPEATVRADIDKWKQFYPLLKGIFFASMSNQASNRTYYGNLNTYAKTTKGFVTTCGSAGAKVPNDFLNGFCADTVIVYEGAGLRTATDYQSYDTLPNSNIGFLAYNIAVLNQAWITQISAYGGWVHMTTDGPPTPWDTLPSYFANLVSHIDAVGSGGGGTPTDKFGVNKIYQTKTGGEEWLVNMESPTSDPRFQNEPTLTRQADGSWQCSGSSSNSNQIRLEAWSPAYGDTQQRISAKWLNVEITAYAKAITEHATGTYLFQWYSRGGHHSTSGDHCEGSALKAALWRRRTSSGNPGISAALRKEVCHAEYEEDKGGLVNNAAPWTSSGFYNRWIGFKHIIYNIQESGNTYTKQEIWVDVNVQDSNGNLSIQNDWKFVTSYTDRGNWFVGSSSFNSDCDGCGKERNEILKEPGGNTNSSSANFNRNLCAWRTDNLTWRWKFLSAREIDHTKLASGPITNPPPVEPGSLFDIFGVRKIYPTKTGGAEWFLAATPTSDSRFNTNGASLTRNSDGSWRIMNNNNINLSVYQPNGFNAGTTSTAATNHSQCASNGYMQDNRDWRNIEMTGYIRLNVSSTAGT